MTCTYPHCEPGQAGTHCRTECGRKKLPKGLDQQGCYPQAAESCTDIGADTDPLRDDMLESVTKVIILAIGVVAGGVITIGLLANL